MKHTVIIAAFTLTTVIVSAQTKSRTKDTVNKNASGSSTHTSNSNPKKAARSSKRILPPGTAIHGGKIVPLHHGKHDYTPGSPIGTGGAGGNTMSGSQESSASENAIGKKASDELLKKNNAIKNKPVPPRKKKQ